ncbi:protein of unknown function DUF20 [Pseudobutyrivibrio sp. YE44]|uniref:AI-2E family transporter n=1 Tax=Pseudobutyrivibrio sp. YE44 TaxID=1520802 RepID=UPI0008911DAE|nr:AI-2E family transporter [Pseudobutyrivibrio sp. YE44]SDB50572.1 protein of unknown function DUF20 [Pseudobutyrivibrio sp. YE44]
MKSSNHEINRTRKLLNDSKKIKKMNKDKIVTHIKNILGIILKYLKCSIIDGAIIGVINFIFMLYMDMPLKVLISIFMGITNLVPSIGPVVGGIISGVVLAFFDIKLALWFLGFTVVLQTIDGLFIKPKLFGDSFGISGVWMFIAMMVAGFFFGIVGLILVVPIVAIIQYVIKVIKHSHKQE